MELQIELEQDEFKKLEELRKFRKVKTCQELIRKLIEEQYQFILCEPCPEFDDCVIPPNMVDQLCKRCPKCFAPLKYPRSHPQARCESCGWKSGTS